jgi:hypothetical protein
VLSRRRLLQLSIYDLLLLTAALTAMLVSYDALAPRALVYTSGFVGGLVGTAIGLSRNEPRVGEALCLGAACGIVGGYLAAFAIESLHRGFPIESDWKWQFRKGRVPATHFGALYGVVGGVVASGLTIAIEIGKGWVRQQRAADAIDKACEAEGKRG